MNKAWIEQKDHYKPTVEVEILDTTLRDGAQSLPDKNQFPGGSKPEITNSIGSLGVRTAEVGFPASQTDSEEVEAVARTAGNTMFPVQRWRNGEHRSQTLLRPVRIAGLSSILPKDVEKTWSAVQYARQPRIHTFIATDAHHMNAKFPDTTPEEILKMGRAAVELARNLADSHYSKDATVEFSAEAATTTDMEYLEKVIKTAIEAGADVINVPDTVGQKSTPEIQAFYNKVIEWVIGINPKVVISAHNHNDFGLANGNTQALLSSASALSVKHNIDIKIQMESTVCGIGERAGNADIFSLAGQLFKFADTLPSNVIWEFNPINSVQIANFVMNMAGLEVSRQNPIVGSDVNKHRSGIHSDGIIKGGYQMYTPYDPTFWGHEAEAIHETGKYQGRNAMKHLS